MHLGQNTDLAFSRFRLLFNSLPDSSRFHLNLKIRRGWLNLYNLFHIFADNIQSADLSKNVWNLCFFFLSIYWRSLKCLCNVISGWMILFSLKSKVITQPRVTLKSQKKIFKSNWNSKLLTKCCFVEIYRRNIINSCLFVHNNNIYKVVEIKSQGNDL